MLRKTMIALCAAASVAALAPDTASARGGFGGGGFRAAALPVAAGFRGGNFAGYRGGFHHGFRHRGFPIAAAAVVGAGLGYGLYGPYGYYSGYDDPYPYYANYGYDNGYYYGDGGCYVVQQRVLTPYGWIIQPVQVCN